MQTSASVLRLPDLENHRQQVENEFDLYYSTYDPYTQPLADALEDMMQTAGNVCSYELKTRQYELLCRLVPVKLFGKTDFFFEICAGRERYTWGGMDSPVGAHLHTGSRNQWILEYLDELKHDQEQAFFQGWGPVGFDHHCPGYDKILSHGLNGIIHQAQELLAGCKDLRKQQFYRCAIRANKALIGLADRFAAAAQRLSVVSRTAEEQAHYKKIARAAAWVPANPPRTFYEALCAILFYRECVGTIEGIGFSTFGQLDRMLYPYYRADIAAGRTTPTEVLRLICDLLLYTEVRFDAKHLYRETSTTIELGGCDRDGNIVYNELTDLILDAVVNVRSINTKINCRISSRHPEAYLQKIIGVQLENLPTLMMHNDDVLIPARVSMGQAVEDARLYVGGGCHEIVLQGSEVCTRADSWISLPRILLATMHHTSDCPDFETFYRTYLRDLKAYHERIVAIKNKGEAMWCQYDPLVLYSSSLSGCLEKGKDLTEGGATYNTIALSMLGIADLVDSLYAIQQLVYNEKRLTMQDFCRILNEDFANDEVLRQYIIKKLPKHGTNDPVINAFTARVLNDISTVSGQTNARGGKYLPAVYPHNANTFLGVRTGATPNGRKACTALSRGVSPSEFIPTDSPLDIIHSLKHIDFTKFADSFITEITLPGMAGNEKSRQTLLAIIRAFLDAGGSSLQFNLIDKETLLAARAAPEQHQHLMVRVCGFSAVFVFLDEISQAEIISRAIR